MLPLKNIRKIAINLDWNVAFNGKSRGNRHLFRVVKIATFIAKKEGADLNIVKAGAWLHDVGLIKGNKDHDVVGAEIARKILKKLKVKNEDIEKIVHCVEAHEGNIPARTIEAKVVHDADVIDKLGPLGVIRHTWKLANEGITTEEISKILKEHLNKRKNTMYTKTGKMLAEKLAEGSEQFFNLLEKQVKLKYLKE